MLSHSLTLVQTTQVLAANVELPARQLPGVFVAVIGTTLIMYLLSFVDKILPAYVRVDNYVRSAIAFIGYGGALSQTPIINVPTKLIQLAVTEFVNQSGWNVSGTILGYGVFTMIFIGLGIWIYKDIDTSTAGWYRPRRLGVLKLVFILVAASYVLSLPVLADITYWVIRTLSIGAFDGTLAVWNFLDRISNRISGVVG